MALVESRANHPEVPGIKMTNTCSDSREPIAITLAPPGLCGFNIKCWWLFAPGCCNQLRACQTNTDVF